eukprot:scaffold24136_cov69-Phaeocystis_antarctica.AAC.1
MRPSLLQRQRQSAPAQPHDNLVGALHQTTLGTADRLAALRGSGSGGGGGGGAGAGRGRYSGPRGSLGRRVLRGAGGAAVRLGATRLAATRLGATRPGRRPRLGRRTPHRTPRLCERGSAVRVSVPVPVGGVGGVGGLGDVGDVGHVPRMSGALGGSMGGAHVGGAHMGGARRGDQGRETQGSRSGGGLGDARREGDRRQFRRFGVAGGGGRAGTRGGVVGCGGV